MSIAGTTIIQEDLKNIIICVDSYEDKLINGRIYNGFLGEEKTFYNLYQLLFEILNTIDKMNFPRPATEKRAFANAEKSTLEKQQDISLQSYQYSLGKISTFNIKILFRQNSSWQGSISWVEGQCEDTFRSALEMLMLIDSAIATDK